MSGIRGIISICTRKTLLCSAYPTQNIPLWTRRHCYSPSYGRVGLFWYGTRKYTTVKTITSESLPVTIELLKTSDVETVQSMIWQHVYLDYVDAYILSTYGRPGVVAPAALLAALGLTQLSPMCGTLFVSSGIAAGYVMRTYLVPSVLTYCVPEARDAKRFLQKYHTTPGNCCLVAKLGSGIVGCISRVSSTTALLENGFVSPDLRRQKVMQQILSSVIRQCRISGYRQAMLRTSDVRGSGPSTLYERLGFRVIEESAGWRHGMFYARTKTYGLII